MQPGRSSRLASKTTKDERALSAVLYYKEPGPEERFSESYRTQRLVKQRSFQ